MPRVGLRQATEVRVQGLEDSPVALRQSAPTSQLAVRSKQVGGYDVSQQREYLQRLFKVDADGNSALDKAQISYLLQTIQFEIDPQFEAQFEAHVDELLSKYHRNRDGAIDYTEFVDAILGLQTASATPSRRAWETSEVCRFLNSTSMHNVMYMPDTHHAQAGKAGVSSQGDAGERP